MAPDLPKTPDVTPDFREGDHVYYVCSDGFPEPGKRLYVGRVYEVIPAAPNLTIDNSPTLKILGLKRNWTYLKVWNWLTGEVYAEKGPAVYPLILLPRKHGM